MSPKIRTTDNRQFPEKRNIRRLTWPSTYNELAEIIHNSFVEHTGSRIGYDTYLFDSIITDLADHLEEERRKEPYSIEDRGHSGIFFYIMLGLLSLFSLVSFFIGLWVS